MMDIDPGLSLLVYVCVCGFLSFLAFGLKQAHTDKEADLIIIQNITLSLLIRHLLKTTSTSSAHC